MCFQCATLTCYECGFQIGVATLACSFQPCNRTFSRSAPALIVRLEERREFISLRIRFSTPIFLRVTTLSGGRPVARMQATSRCTMAGDVPCGHRRCNTRPSRIPCIPAYRQDHPYPGRRPSKAAKPDRHRGQHDRCGQHHRRGQGVTGDAGRPHALVHHIGKNH
jgi:hypothetical protein